MSTKVSKLPVVGYRKPPVHSRYRKGQSGNPGGRPKGMTSGRAAALMQKEAYRRIRVKEGDKVVTMTVFQAVLRSLITLAMKATVVPSVLFSTWCGQSSARAPAPSQRPRCKKY